MSGVDDLTVETGTQDDQGGTRYWTDIVVNEMIMLGSSGGGGAGAMAPATEGYSQPRPTAPITEPDDDLPF